MKPLAMHLRDFPHVYTKAGETPRLVFYTVEARELREDGWVRQERDSATKPEQEQADQLPAEPEKDPVEDLRVPADDVIEVTDEQIDTAEEMEPIVGDIDFEAMTKRELLQYAKDRGVDLPDNALKAELIEACEAI